ncbi:MAG: hypothetical protein K0S56_553 [Microvirga sp.]|jgi:hypothetical protein|nr:hypothetical protein [Microvirga sp.]
MEKNVTQKSHVIVEVDRDYRTVTDTKFMDFSSDEAAREYARKESWTGYSYHAYTWAEYFRERRA